MSRTNRNKAYHLTTDLCCLIQTEYTFFQQVFNGSEFVLKPMLIHHIDRINGHIGSRLKFCITLVHPFF